MLLALLECLVNDPAYRVVLVQHHDNNLRAAVSYMAIYAAHLISFHERTHRRGYQLLFGLKQIWKEAKAFDESPNYQERKTHVSVDLNKKLAFKLARGRNK